MAVSKIVVGENVIDLTNDTGTPERTFLGDIIHLNNGEIGVGTFTIDSELADQDELIDAIVEALNGKVSGGGGITPTGTIEIVTNGEHDVTQYATARVAVPVPTFSTEEKTVSPSTTRQEYTPSAGKDGFRKFTVEAMPSGSVANPTASKSAVSNHSVTITPSVSVTAGYVTRGSKSGTPVSVTAAELVSGSETVNANGSVDVTNLKTVVVALPVKKYYTGTSVPSASLGSDGDIYLMK